MAVATLVAPSTISTRATRVDVMRYPWLFNLCTLGVPVVFLALLAPVTFFGYRASDDCYAGFLVLSDIMASPPVDMDVLMAATASLSAANGRETSFWQMCWGLYAAFLALSIIVCPLLL